MVAIVGRIKPPQMVRVNETGSEFDVYATAGVRGKYSLFPLIIWCIENRSQKTTCST